MPLGVFSSTTSLNFIGEEETLKQLGGEHNPPEEGEETESNLVNVIAILVIVVLAFFLCVAVWSCCRRRCKRGSLSSLKDIMFLSRNKYGYAEEDVDLESSTAVSDYRTSLFSDNDIMINAQNDFLTGDKKPQDEFEAAIDTLEDVSLEEENEDIEAHLSKIPVEGSDLAFKSAEEEPMSENVSRKFDQGTTKPRVQSFTITGLASKVSNKTSGLEEPVEATEPSPSKTVSGRHVEVYQPVQTVKILPSEGAVEVVETGHEEAMQPKCVIKEAEVSTQERSLEVTGSPMSL